MVGINRRLFAVLVLGFSSGLPLALTGGTLQAWYTVSGVSIVGIGMLSLIGQPYVYKFLWAPVLDRYNLALRSDGQLFWGLDRRRSWMVLTQLALAVLLCVMALLNPVNNPLLLAGVAFLVAFFSASQDVALDAYRTDVLPAEERGLGAAMNTGGYRIAMLVSGGLAMVFADYLGWRLVYLIMAGLMGLNAWLTVFAPSLGADAELAPKSLRDAVVVPFREFLSRPRAWGILAFIVLYKLTDVLALSLNTTFLLRALHFTLTDVGSIYKVVGIGATLLGCFVGGLLMKRLSLFAALLWFGFLQGVSALAFMVLAIVGKHYGLMIGAIFLESFFSGMGSVAFVAFLMSLCDARFTATQFALFSSLASAGRVFGGPVAGVLVSYMGWAHFFFVAFMAALPSLAVLYGLRGQVDWDGVVLEG